jgi:hypothetical protein
MNGNHFTTVDHSTTTLTRESCHTITNSSFLEIILFDSPLPLRRSFAFLAKNECITLLILQLVVLALPRAEGVAVDLEQLLIIKIYSTVWTAWSYSHAFAIRFGLGDPSLQFNKGIIVLQLLFVSIFPIVLGDLKFDTLDRIYFSVGDFLSIRWVEKEVFILCTIIWTDTSMSCS